jgi:hypothetical protein
MGGSGSSGSLTSRAHMAGWGLQSLIGWALMMVGFDPMFGLNPGLREDRGAKGQS